MWSALKRGLRRLAPWALLLGSIYWLGSGAGASGAFPTGGSLPELALDLSDGTRLVLPPARDAAGRVVVVNFWASYCGPCRVEAPLLSALHARDAEQVRVVGVSIEGFAPTHMLRTAQQLGMHYPIAAADSALLTRLRVRSVPTTYVIARDGVITLSRVGVVSERELEAAIDAAKRRG